MAFSVLGFRAAGRSPPAAPCKLNGTGAAVLLGSNLLKIYSHREWRQSAAGVFLENTLRLHHSASCVPLRKALKDTLQNFLTLSSAVMEGEVNKGFVGSSKMPFLLLGTCSVTCYCDPSLTFATVKASKCLPCEQYTHLLVLFCVLTLWSHLPH